MHKDTTFSLYIREKVHFFSTHVEISPFPGFFIYKDKSNSIDGPIEICRI